MVRRVKPGGFEVHETQLKQIIEQKSVEFNKARKKIRTSLYASDFGQCPRKVWYQFFPEIFPVEDIDGKTARIFANGEAVHVRLSAYLSAAELMFEDEVNVPRDHLDVHGRCDGVALVEGRATIVEFKSINKPEVAEPKDEHIGQLTWYLGMFEAMRQDLRKEFGIAEDELVYDVDAIAEGGRELTSIERKLLLSQGPIYGEIIYESKPNQLITSFPLEYSAQHFEVVHAWFEELKKAVETKVRPTGKYAATRYPCSWSTGRCSYFKYCHGAGAVDDLVVVRAHAQSTLDVEVATPPEAELLAEAEEIVAQEDEEKSVEDE